MAAEIQGKLKGDNLGSWIYALLQSNSNQFNSRLDKIDRKMDEVAEGVTKHRAEMQTVMRDVAHLVREKEQRDSLKERRERLGIPWADVYTIDRILSNPTLLKELGEYVQERVTNFNNTYASRLNEELFDDFFSWHVTWKKGPM